MAHTYRLQKPPEGIPTIEAMSFDHLIGREVGTVTLLRELGRGGMAVIFTAFQRSLKRQIAVKLLPKPLLTAVGAELFQQEAELAAGLSHPNIMTVYEFGETEEFLFIAMQLVRGRSLLDEIRMARKNVVPANQFLDIGRTLKMTSDVLGALDYAHEQGVIHRDVKPGNVLLEAHTDRPIVSDFGLATMMQVRGGKGTVTAGSPAYMAPEQILSKTPDRRTDVYGAGMMLFEALASQLPLPPFNSTTELLKMKLKLKDRLFLKRPSEMNPHLHREMDQIVSKAIAHTPKKRYRSGGEFREALKGYANRYLSLAL